VDERSEVRLEKKRVGSALVADCRLWSDAVIVAGEDAAVVGKREKRLVQGLVLLFGVITKPCAPHLANEERVPGEHGISYVKADRVHGVARRVQDHNGELPEGEAGPALDGPAGVRIHAAEHQYRDPRKPFQRRIAVGVVVMVVRGKGVADYVAVFPRVADDAVRGEGWIDDRRFVGTLLGDKIPEVPIAPRTELLDEQGASFVADSSNAETSVRNSGKGGKGVACNRRIPPIDMDDRIYYDNQGAVRIERQRSDHEGGITMSKRSAASLLILVIAAGWSASMAASPVINEVAWSGTAASSSDEWIELYNPGPDPIDLAGWTLQFGDTVIHLSVVDGSTREVRSARIEAGGYFLLERTDDRAVSDVDADIIYSGSLSNAGCTLRLVDAHGATVDTANAAAEVWYAGTSADADVPWATMERVAPAADMPDNWASNNGLLRNGCDADGSPINGTPKAENSATAAARMTPQVRLLFPNEAGITLRGKVVVRWEAVDPDGDDAALRIDLWLRSDTNEWGSVADGLANGGAYTWDTGAVADGRSYQLRVVAADPQGFTAMVEGVVFSIANDG